MTSAATGRVEAACRAWARVLGEERTVRDPALIAERARTTLPSAPSPVVILRPAERVQVSQVMRVAGEHGVPVYPISMGRNWGWGDACPAGEGQALLDLGGLDRIVEIDEEVGCAVVEPGVTQGRLAARLERTGSGWIADCTTAGPDTSVLGTTLERGIGQTAFGDRFNHVAGLEAVLGDGTVVRTGFGHFPGAARSMRWGVGPALDGLFSQSSLGVVVEMGVWLLPRPEVARPWLCTFPHERLGAMVAVLRDLRLRHTVRGAPHIFPVARGAGGRGWLGVSAISGSAAAAAVAELELAAALRDIGPLTVWSREDLDDPGAVLARVGLPDVALFREFLTAGEAFARGHPIQLSPAFVRSYVGGDAQRSPGPPQSPDPLDEGYGFWFAWPVAPMTAGSVTALADLVLGTLERHGRPPAVTLSCPDGRAVVAVTRVAFDRSDPDDVRRARECHEELHERCLAAGFPSARAAIDGMHRLDPHGSSHWELVRRLKRLLDPAGAIAPERYVPPRAH